MALADPLMTNSFYGYSYSGHGTTYYEADIAYRIASPRPVWPQETTYEGEDNTGGLPSDHIWTTRRTRWWAALAGATAGDGFGSIEVWKWNYSTATSWLGTPGALAGQYAFSLLSTLPWWDLQPSGTGTGFAGRTLVTAGAGTWGNEDVVTSALTSDHAVLVAYLPGTNRGTAALSITVDLSALRAPARARWWNPTTGTATLIGTYGNTGTATFTTPGSNGAGNDWILVLDLG
jgi:hypothetical protein